ncbi:MAG: RNA 2',3'-cyclic phosphodiesterase [Candidatus Brocadiia bacterium]
MRAFIAIELDPAIRQRLAEAQEPLRQAGGKVKWVGAERMHLTVKFLGEIEEGQVDAVAEAMGAATAAAEPFEIALAGLGSFPPRGAPRVVWAGVRDASGALADLHRRLEGELEALGFEREKRPFRPHLTLGRVKDRRAGRALAPLIAQQESTDFGTQVVDALVLFQSVLSPQGPTHTALRRQAL